MAETHPFFYSVDLVRNIATGEHVALCRTPVAPGPLGRLPLGQGATVGEALCDLACVLEHLTGWPPCAQEVCRSADYVCLQCWDRARFDGWAAARQHRLEVHRAVSYLPDVLPSLG